MLARNGRADFIEVRFENLAVAKKHPRSLDRGRFAPGGKRGMRGLHRGVYLGAPACRTFRDNVAGGGIKDRRMVELLRRLPFAADEIGAGKKRRAHDVRGLAVET